MVCAVPVAAGAATGLCRSEPGRLAAAGKSLRAHGYRVRPRRGGGIPHCRRLLHVPKQNHGRDRACRIAGRAEIQRGPGKRRRILRQTNGVSQKRASELAIRENGAEKLPHHLELSRLCRSGRVLSAGRNLVRHPRAGRVRQRYGRCRRTEEYVCKAAGSSVQSARDRCSPFTRAC